MGELRLILLGIGLVLLAAIWWWTARGSGQARGAAELREKVGRSEAEPVPRAPAASDLSPAPEGREWGVSPLEPLSITTAEYDDVPILDLPMMVEPAARSRVRTIHAAHAPRAAHRVRAIRAASDASGRGDAHRRQRPVRAGATAQPQ